MGGNVCKACDNYMKMEEQNLSQNRIEKQVGNYNNINQNSQILYSTIIKQPSINKINPEINNQRIDKDNNNIDNNKPSINKTILENEEKESPPIGVDQNELNKIIFKYKLRLLISFFRKFKKMKEEAHKIITIRNNLKEKRNLISLEGLDNLNVDLFPSESYNFLGNIFDEKEDGFGIQYFPKKKAKYVGKFINGKRIDFGYFEDKSNFYIYKGETKKNFTGLYGIYYNYEKQITYEGEWLNNRKDGIGMETYRDGSKYLGEHKNGLKHGLGTYFWADGSVYEGEWKYNLMDGYGIYKFKDGSICSGFWNSNQMNGFGKFTFPEVKCYIGFFKNDNKSGFGLIFWYKEKKAFIGYWKDNRQDGLGKFIYEGKKRYGFWKQGNRETKIEENEFYALLNEQSTSQIYLNIFEMDYDGLKEYIQNFNF